MKGWRQESERHMLASRGVKTKTDKLKQLSKEVSNLIREIENNPTYRTWQNKNWDDLVAGYKDYKSDFQNSDEHPKPFNEWAMLRFGLFAQGIAKIPMQIKTEGVKKPYKRYLIVYGEKSEKPDSMTCTGSNADLRKAVEIIKQSAEQVSDEYGQDLNFYIYDTKTNEYIDIGEE